MSNLGLEHALRQEGIDFEGASVGDRYVMEEMRKEVPFLAVKNPATRSF